MNYLSLLLCGLALVGNLSLWGMNNNNSIYNRYFQTEKELRGAFFSKDNPDKEDGLSSVFEVGKGWRAETPKEIENGKALHILWFKKEMLEKRDSEIKEKGNLLLQNFLTFRLNKNYVVTNNRQVEKNKILYLYKKGWISKQEWGQLSADMDTYFDAQEVKNVNHFFNNFSLAEEKTLKRKEPDFARTERQFKKIKIEEKNLEKQ